MTTFDIMKRTAEVVGATGVVYAAVVGFIVAFGGHIPPWATIAQAQSLEDTIKSFKADQVRQDKKLESNIDLLTLERLRDEVKAATEKAERNPRDSELQSDKWFAQKKLDIFFKAHPELAAAMH